MNHLDAALQPSDVARSIPTMNQPEARRVDVRPDLQDGQPSCLGERNIRFGNFPALSQEPEDNGGPVVITMLLTALICLAVGFLGGYWMRGIA